MQCIIYFKVVIIKPERYTEDQNIIFVHVKRTQSI